MPVFKNRVGFIRQFKEYVDFVADKGAYAGLIGRLRVVVCGLACGGVRTCARRGPHAWRRADLTRGDRLTQALNKAFSMENGKIKRRL